MSFNVGRDNSFSTIHPTTSPLSLSDGVRAVVRICSLPEQETGNHGKRSRRRAVALWGYTIVSLHRVNSSTAPQPTIENGRLVVWESGESNRWLRLGENQQGRHQS
uniref:Uncharacterized protein n=1 Tax=Photinus pyralis TaxID=7054 RepID=A0A1Y1LVC3_PHOPY